MVYIIQARPVMIQFVKSNVPSEYLILYIISVHDLVIQTAHIIAYITRTFI